MNNYRLSSICLFSLCFFMVAAPAKSFAWELAKDADGIRVYTRTIPGSGFKEYKAQVTIRSSLSSLVALVDDIGACPKWIDTCAKGRLLKRINPRESYTYTINHAPWPVSDRDAVVHNIIRQDPGSRIVTIQIKGISDYVPEKPGLVRVKRRKGFWRFTPLEDGSVRVTYQVICRVIRGAEEYASPLSVPSDALDAKVEVPLVGRWASASNQGGKPVVRSGEHHLEIEIKRKPNSNPPAFEGWVVSRGAYYEKKRPTQKSRFINENEHYLTITLLPEASASTDRILFKVDGLSWNNYGRPWTRIGGGLLKFDSDLGTYTITGALAPWWVKK